MNLYFYLKKKNVKNQTIVPSLCVVISPIKCCRYIASFFIVKILKETSQV